MNVEYQDAVVLLGDSLTQCVDIPGNLTERFSTVYSRRLDVYNRGFNGYSSEWIRAFLPRMFAKTGVSGPKIRLVTIWLGTNDASLPPHERGVPIDRFKENMNHILSCLTDSSLGYAASEGSLAIILITPTYPIVDMIEPAKQMYRDVEHTRKYQAAILDLGKEWKDRISKTGGALEVYDFWKGMVEDAGGEGDPLRPYYTDGVHLSTKGYDLLWRGVSSIITDQFKGRGVDFIDQTDLPWTMPGTEGKTAADLLEYRAERKTG